MILWCWRGCGTGVVMKLWTIIVIHYFRMLHTGPELASKRRSMTRLWNLRQSLLTKICVRNPKNPIRFRQVVYVQFDLELVWMKTFQYRPLVATHVRRSGSFSPSIAQTAQCTAYAISPNIDGIGVKGIFVECITAQCWRKIFVSDFPRWCGRVWWILAFVLSLIMCGILINNLYTKWQLSPVIVSFAQQPTPIWKIPFPAVTICPVTKTKNNYLNFTAAYYSMWNAAETPNMTVDEYVEQMSSTDCRDQISNKYYLQNRPHGRD